ncbi:phosphoribosyltransferase family protein [Mailhella sp.]
MSLYGARNIGGHIRSAFGKTVSVLTSFLMLEERRCASCREPFVPRERGAAEQLFCPACLPSFQRRQAGYCPHCGEPYALSDAPVVPCGECLQKLPPWNEFLFYGIYEGELRELIMRGKFSGSLDALHSLGLLLAEICAEHYSAGLVPDVVVPLPLHPARLRERGLDQCLEMARPVAKALGIPVRNDILRRKAASVPQSTLDREKRKKLHQPFAASPEAAGLRILLLDDVCTTGATLSRAAECLLQAGAASVDVVVAARASRHSSPPSGRSGRALP